MTIHTTRRSVRTENYKISYRYIPGSLGNGSSLDHGAVMTIARRTIQSARKAYETIRADRSRIQWVALSKMGYGHIDGEQVNPRDR